MMTQEAPAVLECRYRLATGCDRTYAAEKKQGMYAHEKISAAHEGHRVTLRDCPVCGRPCGDEVQRATHLALPEPAGHGIAATSARRRELDAVQVKKLYDEQYAPAPAESAALNGTGVFEPDGHPSLNGDSPAVLDLPAVVGMFGVLVAEVERLRALEPDAAAYRKLRADMLGQG